MANVNVTIDDSTKERMEELLNHFGLTIDVAIKMFFTQAIREQALPFNLKLTDEEIFYSKSNVEHILQGIRQLENANL
ncbi:MAG: type II toxin-antitoxin system RelB/DinJ family antitoxin [Defluviitaleaceae bacterium]|nr:type II toxin-antitoxin system RelB/DinJ family antitoxin [Defluviitaleaceae bacterium]